jgi:hypothetical protein
MLEKLIVIDMEFIPFVDCEDLQKPETEGKEPFRIQ